jgi:imidazolonepropionase-like amidohydrolase
VPEYAVAGIWAGRAQGACILHVEDGVVARIEPTAPDVNPAAVTVLPGLVDRHVHLGLVDHGALADGPVVEVHDLGWVPAEIVALRDRPPAGVTVRVAGPFHTAPGGYPSGRSWAPAAAVRAVDSVAAARRAVTDAVGAGYDVLKVALHSGMPLLGDEVLRSLVSAAHGAGLPVVVHAEGAGQAARAIDVGADLLAHAPWTERVPDDVLARGTHMTWCSTVAIHSRTARATAIDNIRRFRALGGQVVYGTDMGNGPAPAGANAAEILALGVAGLTGDALLAALCGPPADRLPVGRLLISKHPVPVSAADAVFWFADCRRFTAADLKEHHGA